MGKGKRGGRREKGRGGAADAQRISRARDRGEGESRGDAVGPGGDGSDRATGRSDADGTADRRDRKSGRSGGAQPNRLLLLGGAFAAIVAVILAWLWLGGGASSFRGNTGTYNVLLVTMDTTRADRIGCYGYERVRTPIIDGIADQGVLFENAYAQAVMTLPSHTSIMSGHVPPAHGVRINGSALVRPEVETLAEILKAAGFLTGAAVSAVVLDSMFGLDQGFDHYDDNVPESGSHDVFFSQRPAREVTDAALSWLNTARAGRWFLWAHYFDPHTPFAPPSPFREQYGARSYEGEIAYMDSEIGRLLEGVREAGAADRTIVVLVGDHGEGLRDHGEMTHGVFLYDEISRVPLVISVPGYVTESRRVKPVVRTTDIMPTILDLLRLPTRPSLDGVSLWPLISGATEDLGLSAYMESPASALMYGWSPLAALRAGSWKYIHGPEPELYDIEADPGERQNVISTQREVADDLRERMRGMLTAVTPVKGNGSVSLSPEEEARLRSLGYTGGAGGEFGEVLEADPAAVMAGASYGLVDPKRKVEALERINKISMAYGTGDFDSAVGLARGFLAEEPDNGSVRQFLADALRGLEKYDEALSEYGRILEESPNNVDVLLNIGFIQSKQGRIDAARATYLHTLELHPNHIYALSSLGNLYFLEGNYQEAADYYRKVLLDRPTHWKSIVAMAQINREKGYTKEAKVLFRRAVEINPRDIDSALTLGWMHFVDGEQEQALAVLDAADRSFPGLPEIRIARGDVLSALARLDEAERDYRTALERAPQAAQAWQGLGRIAAQRGDKAEARRLLEQALRINPGSRAAREELLRLGS